MSLSGSSVLGLSFDSKFLYLAEFKGRVFQEELNQDFSVALKRTLEKNAPRVKNIVMALPTSEALVRCFEIPLIPAKELPQAIRFEAQKYMPFELKDLATDYQAFPNHFQKRLSVIFYAVKKEVVENFKKMFTESGAPLSVVEPDALSLLRIYGTPLPKKKDQVQALISVHEDGGLDLLVEKNHRLLMTRNSHLADQEMNFDGFLKEVNLSFNYFAKNFKMEEIKRIRLIAQPKTRSQEWIEGLKTQFEVPVDEASSVSPGLAAAIGAASPEPFSWQDLGRKRPNLLPKESAAGAGAPIILPAAEEMRILKKWAVIDIAAIVGIVLLVHIFLISKIMNARSMMVKLEKSFPAIVGVAPATTVDQLSDVRETLEKKTAYLSSMIDQRVYWTEKLDGIARATPIEMQLTRLEASDRDDVNGHSDLALSIQGVVPLKANGDEMSVVKQLVNALRQNPRFMKGFDSVKISNVRKEITGAGDSAVMVFMIECDSARRQPGL